MAVRFITGLIDNAGAAEIESFSVRPVDFYADGSLLVTPKPQTIKLAIGGHYAFSLTVMDDGVTPIRYEVEFGKERFQFDLVSGDAISLAELLSGRIPA